MISSLQEAPAAVQQQRDQEQHATNCCDHPNSGSIVIVITGAGVAILIRPCILNRTAGAMSFVTWDGSNLAPSGVFVDARYAGRTGAYSEFAKRIPVQMVPATANVTAVGGSQFTLEYNVRDNAGNAAVAEIVTLEVVDNTPPTISLRGDQQMDIEAGLFFEDPGATALDARQLDLTNDVRVEMIRRSADGGNSWVEVNDLDACGRAAGSTSSTCQLNVQYELTYAVSDANANLASATRTVTLVDNTPPAVYPLVGETYEVAASSTPTAAAGTRAAPPPQTASRPDRFTLRTKSASSGATLRWTVFLGTLQLPRRLPSTSSSRTTPPGLPPGPSRMPTTDQPGMAVVFTVVFW